MSRPRQKVKKYVRHFSQYIQSRSDDKTVIPPNRRKSCIGKLSTAKPLNKKVSFKVYSTWVIQQNEEKTEQPDLMNRETKI